MTYNPLRLDIVASYLAAGVSGDVAAYDEKNLYVAYDVTAPAELVNSFQDLNLIFKGGNCLDIQLGANPSADPKRKKPAPGDVRILVTRQKGKGFAVVYRPKVKDFTGKPIVLISPTGKESFDLIEIVRTVDMLYKKKRDGNGFNATVAVPLALLKLDPKPNTFIKMDLGYIFGNLLGNQAAVRAYWINNSFSANVTYDVPNESRLEPHEWGEAAVE